MQQRTGAGNPDLSSEKSGQNLKALSDSFFCDTEYGLEKCMEKEV